MRAAARCGFNLACYYLLKWRCRHRTENLIHCLVSCSNFIWRNFPLVFPADPYIVSNRIFLRYTLTQPCSSHRVSHFSAVGKYGRWFALTRCRPANQYGKGCCESQTPLCGCGCLVSPACLPGKPAVPGPWARGSENRPGQSGWWPGGHSFLSPPWSCCHPPLGSAHPCTLLLEAGRPRAWGTRPRAS